MQEHSVGGHRQKGTVEMCVPFLQCLKTKGEARRGLKVAGWQEESSVLIASDLINKVLYENYTGQHLECFELEPVI